MSTPAHKQQKDSEIKALIFEVTFYAVFLVCFLSMSFSARDPRAFIYHRTTSQLVTDDAVREVLTSYDIWKWAHKKLLKFLYVELDWRGTRLEPASKLVSTHASYRLGPIRLRQHRVAHDFCTSASNFLHLNVTCCPSWSQADREWTHYGHGWAKYQEQRELTHTASPVNDSYSPASTVNESISSLYSKYYSTAWKYQTWSDIGGLPITGALGVYPPGGYALDVVGTKAEAAAAFEYLEESAWIDHKTRVVIFEVSIYTANLDMYAMITALFEFHQAHLAAGNIHIHPFRLYRYSEDYPVTRMACEAFVYASLLFFWARHLYFICKQGVGYFKHMWNLLEALNLLTSTSAIALSVGRNIVSDDVTKVVIKDEGHFYNFQTLAMWELLTGYLSGFACFLSSVQVLNLLRFNRRMSVLGVTMGLAADDLWPFSLVFTIVLIAFASSCHLVFGPWLRGYKTLVDTYESLLQMALGQLEYQSLHGVNNIFAPVYIFLYSIFIIHLLLNILITILVDSYAVVRKDNQPNDYELIDYIIGRVTGFLWSYSPFRRVWACAHYMGILRSKKPSSKRRVSKKRQEKRLSFPHLMMLYKEATDGMERERAITSRLYARWNQVEEIVNRMWGDMDTSPAWNTEVKARGARAKISCEVEVDIAIRKSQEGKGSDQIADHKDEKDKLYDLKAKLFEKIDHQKPPRCMCKKPDDLVILRKTRLNSSGASLDESGRWLDASTSEVPLLDVSSLSCYSGSGTGCYSGSGTGWTGPSGQDGKGRAFSLHPAGAEGDSPAWVLTSSRLLSPESSRDLSLSTELDLTTSSDVALLSPTGQSQQTCL
ncbi:polycystin-2-like protein 1 isoform X2 [Physella acuta]|uniref:polycystin-2-like protein 1 isoform X2 n=1 Tax=Physella acuta TaxID=109671 RepID=UPI0027DC7EF9|nr:polycystin-2-like protein 1 isoform X2 [Physella acuta]